MGREIKRVPLDFDWPLEKVWDGFQTKNPHYIVCPNCENGYNGASKWLQSIGYLIASIADDAVNLQNPRPGRVRMHPYLTSLMNRPDVDPSMEITEWLKGIGLKPDGPFGYHGFSIYEKLRDFSGLDRNWEECSTCKGHAIDPNHYEAYKKFNDEWEETPVPEGEGYQVWETVSEGSPVSPVFESKEKMVEWLISEGYSKTAAENFVKSEWVPSMIMTNTGMYSDIEAASQFKGD